MDFELTEAQQEIVQQIRAMGQKFPDEYWRDRDARAEFPHEFYAEVARGGWLGVAIPEQYGGSGLGITEAALVMREVAGDSAVFFDPLDPASIARTLEALLADPDERERLRTTGRSHAAWFTWQRTAEGTLRCYERTVGRSLRGRLV